MTRHYTVLVDSAAVQQRDKELAREPVDQGEPKKPAPTPAGGEIINQVEAAMAGVGITQKMLADLADTLGPVLQPEIPTPAPVVRGEVEETSAQSPLGERLADLSRSINAINDQIASLTSRLAI